MALPVKPEYSGSPRFDPPPRWSIVGLTFPPFIQKLSSITCSSTSAAPRYTVYMFVSQRTTNFLFDETIWLSTWMINSDQASFDSHVWPCPMSRRPECVDCSNKFHLIHARKKWLFEENDYRISNTIHNPRKINRWIRRTGHAAGFKCFAECNDAFTVRWWHSVNRHYRLRIG